MRRIDVDQAASRGVRPLVALASAWEHERINLTVLDDAEMQVAIVWRRGYRVPIVQSLTSSFTALGEVGGYVSGAGLGCVRSKVPQIFDRAAGLLWIKDS